jgi:hypothetical protein
MIIFFSDGKLGNQLFQYAFLKTIAKKDEKIIATNMDNLLEVMDCNDEHFKNFSLGKYRKFIVNRFIRKILVFLTKLKLIGYIKQDRNETSALPSYTEKKGIFPITFVDQDFFQSEKFFDPEKFHIDIKQKYMDIARNIVEKIDSGFTRIFVHVRRGDYLFEKYLDEVGIDLPRSYFTKAMEAIKKEVENPFFIFLSDDPGFVECCFQDEKNKYVSRNDMGVDLALMTLCEYGIVSNSSFSWWGAYLMQNRKKVIFPNYWYGWKQKIASHIDVQPSWAEVIEVE